MDEPRAKGLIALGVRDILVKPLDGARLERLTKCVSLIEADSGGSRARQPAARLPASSTAIIADGDKDYRDYFAKAVNARLTLTHATSGARALDLCHPSPPDIVFLGTDLGLMERAQVARRLRAIHRRTARIIAIPQKSEVEADRASGLYDDVLQRTYAPAAFEKELARWLQGTTTFERLSGRLPNIRLRIVRAAEQVFGTMLGADVEPQDGQTSTDEATATASVTLASPPFVATLRVRYGMVSAKTIAGAFTQSDVADLSDEGVVAVAGEVATLLGERVKAALEGVGLDATLGMPEAVAEPGGHHAGPLAASEGVDVSFHAVDRPLTFRIQLTAEPSDAEGRTGLDQSSEVTTTRAEA
jgi:CheY-like chemotaxis protein